MFGVNEMQEFNKKGESSSSLNHMFKVAAAAEMVGSVHEQVSEVEQKYMGGKIFKDRIEELEHEFEHANPLVNVMSEVDNDDEDVDEN